MTSSNLLHPSEVAVDSYSLAQKTALLSIDIETDFGTDRTEALSQVGRFLEFFDEFDIPITAFVEGRLFETRKDLCSILVEHGVDLQLHCYDHRNDGDTPDSLLQGIAAYAEFTGKPPKGYRAHTYRLDLTLYHALIKNGFKWDSSILPAVAQGGNFAPQYRARDYMVFENRLVEFPVATWRQLPIPLNHSYRLLMGRPAEALIRKAFGPNQLVAYNMHMVDLVYCRSLDKANLPLLVKTLYRYMWGANKSDTFRSLRSIVEYLDGLGYEFCLADTLYQNIIDEVAPIHD